jgi:hypothetical protein
MFEKNGICYAGTPEKPVPYLRVTYAEPREDYVLYLKFNNGEERLYNFAPLLEYPVFKPLKDKAVFNSVALDGSTTVWLDRTIDLDQYCYLENGTPCKNGIAMYNVK